MEEPAELLLGRAGICDANSRFRVSYFTYCSSVWSLIQRQPLPGFLLAATAKSKKPLGRGVEDEKTLATAPAWIGQVGCGE